MLISALRRFSYRRLKGGLRQLKTFLGVRPVALSEKNTPFEKSLRRCARFIVFFGDQALLPDQFPSVVTALETSRRNGEAEARGAWR